MGNTQNIELQPKTNILGAVEAQAARLQSLGFEDVLGVLNAGRNILAYIRHRDSLDARYIGEFGQVDAQVGIGSQQIKELRREISENQSVGFGNLAEVIGAGDAARSGHVLNHDRWLTRDVFSQEARDQSSFNVGGPARGKID